MGTMRYKPSDKVRIKSLDWYNENKDKDDNVVCFYSYFDKGMSKFCNKIVTIKSLHGCPNVKAFRIIEDDGYSWWSDDMIEGLVEDETTSDKVIEEAKTYWDSIKDAWICPEGYQFVDENGNVINATKIVLEKKKKEYPKTYEECCKVLNIEGGRLCFNNSGITQYERDLYIMMNNLSKLLICRDAYWKIAGEEMGLDKPWEPDWNGKLYYLYYNPTNTTGVVRGFTSDGVLAYVVLAFPTEEMRDDFYENFKEEIEECKELL